MQEVKKERVEVETYYVDGIKVTVERIFIKSGKNMIDRLFDYFEEQDRLLEEKINESRK